MAKKRKSGDYEGWILRLIDKIEDLQYSLNLRSWLDFAAEKISKEHGYDITEPQVAKLADLRFDVNEMVGGRVNVSVEYKTRYRLKGRFVSEAVPGAKAESVIRYRNVSKSYGQRTGTMVKPERIDAEISRLKLSKVWDK